MCAVGPPLSSSDSRRQWLSLAGSHLPRREQIRVREAAPDRRPDDRRRWCLEAAEHLTAAPRRAPPPPHERGGAVSDSQRAPTRSTSGCDWDVSGRRRLSSAPVRRQIGVRACTQTRMGGASEAEAAPAAAPAARQLTELCC